MVDTNTGRDAMQCNALSGIHIHGGCDTQTLLAVDGMPMMPATPHGTTAIPLPIA